MITPAVILGGAVLLLLILLGLRRSTQDTHSPEYQRRIASPGWRLRARICLRFTKGRCALLPWLRAVEAHHLHYRNLGSEWLIRDIVPLSTAGHTIAHAWICWRGPLRPVMTGMLRCSTLLTALIVRPYVAILLLAMCIWGGSHALIAIQTRFPAWTPWTDDRQISLDRIGSGE